VFFLEGRPGRGDFPSFVGGGGGGGFFAPFLPHQKKPSVGRDKKKGGREGETDGLPSSPSNFPQKKKKKRKKQHEEDELGSLGEVEYKGRRKKKRRKKTPSWAGQLII